MSLTLGMIAGPASALGEVTVDGLGGVAGVVVGVVVGVDVATGGEQLSPASVVLPTDKLTHTL